MQLLTHTPTNVIKTNRFTGWMMTLMMFVITLFSSFISYSQTTFNTSGTYTVPAGVTAITVNVWGAGGGGGGGFNGCTSQGEGSGGGGGGFAATTFAVVPGQVYTITVGAGGPGAAYNGNGSAGGATMVTGPQSTIIATGGGGGLGGGACGTVAGGAGGTGTSGAIFFTGGSGSAGIHTGTTATGVSGKGGGGAGSGGNGTTPNTACPGTTGTGGPGTFAGGNGGVTASCGVGTDAAGQPGAVRGGGGSGGQGWLSTTGVGGTGGSGQVVIQEVTVGSSCVSPTTAPTSLNLTAPLSNRINVSYTAAAGADGYLIVRYPTGSSPTAPSDGTLYSAGSALGSGTVVGYGGIAFAALGLAPATTYDFYVYSANTVCNGGPLYFGTPLMGTASTPALPASTALGGLWSSPATWITGVVPAGLEDVTIVAGAVVTVDQVVTAPNLTINGILQWNATANPMTITGNLTVNSGGQLLAYTTALNGVIINIAGNYTNNGYANHAGVLANNFALNFNGAGSTLGGSGTFAGDGTNGIIRSLAFQNLGSNAITTTQNLIVNATTGGVSGMALTAGSLNTNGKLRIDNTAQVYGQPFNLQVASLAVTAMGSLYSISPVVFGVAVTQWSNVSGIIGTRYVSGNNVYVCVTAGSIGPTAPTHTSGISQNLLWLAPVGTLGNPAIFNAASVVGTQYFYGGNLYTCIIGGLASSIAPPTHTSGIAISGAASFLYVGTPATASVNYLASNQTVRSLNLTSPGSGYSSAPSIAFSVGVAGGTGSGAVATAVYIQQLAGPSNSLFQKTTGVPITGGIIINSDQGVSGATAHPQGSSGVGALSTTGGGVNYSVAPVVGFALPPALNLITNPGSGYTAVPTVTVTGGNLVSGTALTTANFTITVNQGMVESVYLNTGTTATYSTLPILTLTAPGAGTPATLEFPAGCLPVATANIGSNGQITSFIVNSPGFGYPSAPTVGIGTTNGSPNGGIFTTAATTPTARIALYNLSLSFFAPAAAPTVNSDDASIPASRKMNNLSLGGNGLGLNLSNNLTLFGTAPLTLTASGIAPGNVLNLGGNNLNFTWNGYGGTTSTFGVTNVYIKNGSMSLTGRGGASTFSFPFSGTFTWFAGSTPTAITTGSTVTRVTVTETGAPTGTGAIGTRAFLVNNGGGIQGLNPTVTMNWNSIDALTGNLQDLYISQSTALSGPWAPRSLSTGSGAITATGVRTTATVAPGPIVPTGNDYFAWTIVTIDTSNVTVQPKTCTATSHLVSANLTTSLGNVTGVTISYNNGTAAGPFAMTNTTGNTWQYTIPAASPTNTMVTWSITATTSAGITKTFTGIPYQDDELNGSVTTAVASPSTVCAGSPTTLTAQTTISANGSATVGAQTTTEFEGVYRYGFATGDYRHQLLFTAAELTAAGFGAGNISAVTFNVTSVGSGSANNYTIKMAHTAATALTATFATGTFTTCYVAPTYTAVSGNNVHTFTTPFNWNGSSNVLVDVCYNISVLGGSSTVAATTPASIRNVNLKGSAGACTAAGGGATFANRPLARFTGILVNNLTPSMSWVWNPGAIAGNNVVVNPSTTTTYTATGTTSAGCTVTSPGVVVTTTALPSAPNGSNSTQCGTGIPDAFVVTTFPGSSSGAFRWYAAQTGGTALQSGGSTYATAISTTTVFWVSEFDGTCESARTQVTAFVSTPDAVNASADAVTSCINRPIELSVIQEGTTQTYTYSWSASPVAGSGIPTTVPGNPVSVTPTVPGTFIYTVTATDGDCVTTDNVSVTIQPPPVINTPTATPATVCAGVSSTLTATTNTVAPGTFQIGSGTGTNSGSSTIGAFYGTWYGNGHAQILIRASELTALGFVAGNLTALSINISSIAPDAPDQTVNGFTIKLGSVPAGTTTITTFQAPTFTTVYGPTNYTPVVGLNTHTFTSGYAWDGTSNIIVDYCFANGITGNGSAVNTVTTTSTSSFVNHQVDGVVSNVCSITTVSNTSTSRPNIRLTGLVFPVVGPGTLSWVWNPGSLPGNSVTVSPATTTTYTVTATDPATTCTNTKDVTVTVNQLPAAPSGTNSEQCGAGVPDASVSSNSGAPTPVFRWYSAATGGTLLQSGTSTGYLTSVSVTTNFYVAELSAQGCEGPRTLVTAAVITADPVTANVTDASLCLGESTDLSVTHIPVENTYTYSWAASPVPGSGMPVSVPGTPVSVTPTAVGSYIYTVTAFDADKGCTTTSSITVTVSGLPVIDSIRANPSTVCAGGPVSLKVYSAGGFVTGPQTPPTGYCTTGFYSSGCGAFGDFIANVSFAGVINRTSVCDNTATGGAYSSYSSPMPTVTKGLIYPISVTTTTNDVEGVTVWIDYDRNGVFSAAEAVFTPAFANVTGAVYSGNITIPSTASTGQTMMRVRMNFNQAPATNSACLGGQSWGEIEDYLINIQAIQTQNPVLTYTWNPGALTGANVTVNPTTTTTYTATVTTPATGCSSTATVGVTVNPLPSAPTTTPSTQCGAGIPTASASGSTNGNYRWYLVPTGGTAIAGEVNSVLGAYSISAPTTFYVAISDGTCESLRTSVLADVTTPPTISTAGSTGSSVCLNSMVTLNATSSESNYVYTWTASPGAGSGITGSLPGSAPGTSSNTITPTATGTYTYTVSGTETTFNCTAIATVVVTVNPNPAVPNPTATPNTVCDGGASQLNAGTFVSGSLTTPVAGGNGNQGNIFDITVTNTVTITSISMGITAGTFAEVWYKPTSYGCVSSVTSNAGWTLLTPSGGSAITPAGASPNLTNIPLTTFITIPAGQTYGFAVVCNGTNYYTDGATLCTTWASDANITIGQGIGGSAVLGGGAWTFTNSVRNFNGSVGYSYGDANLNYSWSPSGSLNSSIIIDPIATPSVTTAYTVTVTNTFGCSATSAPVTVTVQPVGANATATPSPSCAGAPVTLNANPTGGGPFTFSWSDGTTVVGTTNPLVVSPTVTTTYTVTVTDVCGNPITSSVTVTVNPLPSAGIAGTGPISICDPSTQVLTAVTNAASPTYQWKKGGVNIGGATSSTYTVSGVGTGSYTVQVTDGSTGCVNTSSAVVVTINQKPTAVTITPANPSRCLNDPATLLTASGGTTLTPTTGNITGTAPTTTTSAESPFYRTFEGSRKQYLMTAAELTTLGMSNGSVISSLAFNITSMLRTTNINHENFNIKIAATSQTDLTTTYVTTGLAVVYGPVSYSPVVGANTFNFSSAFTWNGTSNVVIEVCWDNDPTGACTLGSPVCWSNAATVSVATAFTGATRTAYSDNSAGVRDICAVTTSSLTTASRPVITLGFTTITPSSITWSPVGGLYTNAAATTAYSGQATTTVYAKPSATEIYTATATSAANCSNSGTATVTVIQPFVSPTPDPISGPTNTCPYIGTNTPVTYSVPVIAGTTYTWVVPPTNVTIVGGQGTASVSVTFSNGFASQANKQIRVSQIVPCGTASAQRTLILLAQFPTTPGAITGPTSVCPFIGTGMATYSVAPVTAATSYIWTAQSGNTTITYPNGTGVNGNTINVAFGPGFTTSALTVQAVNTCGPSGVRSLTLVRANPAVGPISGPTNACPYMLPNGTPATYSVVAVSGVTSYTWTAPTGSVVTYPNGTGANGNTITVQYPAGFTSGSISVSVTNGCGTSAVRTLNISKLLPAAPGNIDVIQTQPCPDRVYTYSISAIPANATSVLWTIPAGATLVSGQGTTTITVSYPGTAINDSVTVQSVSNCASSVKRKTLVKLAVCTAPPPPPFAGVRHNGNILQVKGNVQMPVEVPEGMEVKIFPNPTVHDFKLQVLTSGKEAIRVKVLDAAGRLYREFKTTPFQVIALGSELKAGAYMIEVVQGNLFKTAKVIKF